MNYFNDSIAILTIGIGSLFSGIEVHRNDKGVFKVIKVPLMFAGKSHWYQKQFKNLVDVENISKVLPQMSFQLTNLQYDPDRQTNKFEKIKINQIESSPLYHFAKKWLQTRIPYIFTFTLSIQVKFFTDLNQILEQVLPYFPAGARNLHIKEIPILDVHNTVRVVMQGQSPEITVDFAENEDRLIQYEITFDVYSNLYPPYKTSEIIKEVDMKIYMAMLANNYEDTELIAEFVMDETGTRKI